MHQHPLQTLACYIILAAGNVMEDLHEKGKINSRLNTI